MSRAFVKEDDDAREPPIPERPISAAPNRVTARGAALIVQTIAALQEALGHTSDAANAAAIRRDLRYWHSRHASMQLVVVPAAPAVVAFGTRVTFRRGGVTHEMQIVGEDEADPPAGTIAWTAPLARALEGAEVGDVVELAAGRQREQIVVVAIRDDRMRG